MKAVLNSRKELHFAEALIEGKATTVLKGAKININSSFPKMVRSVVALREDRSTVSAEGILLHDVTFDSPSTAAQFVTGRSVNGYIVWRPNDEMPLREYLKR